MRKLNQILYLISSVLLLCGIFTPVQGEIHIGDVFAYWENEFAVIQAEIIDPFTPDTRKTLHSGMPVAIDMEVRLFRTGYAADFSVRATIKYNVWQENFLIITDVDTMVVEDFGKVLNVLRKEFKCIIPAKELPKKGPWFVKARAGERRIIQNSKSNMVGIEKELTGLAKWLFKRGEKDEKYSKWSELIELPKLQVD